jgi:hypothetical protein
MRTTRSSVIVSAVAVGALLLAGCAREPQQQSVAEQLVNAQGQTGASGQAAGPDGTTSSPDDETPSGSPSDDRSSEAPNDDATSAEPTTDHSESESSDAPESSAPSASSSRTRTATAGPSATSRPRPSTSPTHGGGGGGPQADRIKVSKCYTNATRSTGGELLIKASSSDPSARLIAYRSDGSRIGEVQNGGGSRYGGTVMPYQPHDPGSCVIRSSSGGSITVPTTPFRL